MPIKETVEELMERKMNRSEFLRMIAITLAGIIGISRFIGALKHGTSVQQGYGAGPYGGGTDKTAFLKKPGK